MNPVARVVSTVALAATGFFTLYAFQTLPADAQLAIHWDVNGVAEGFAGREARVALPAVCVRRAALLLLAIKLDPKRANIVRSAEAIGYVAMGLVLLFAVTQSAIINSGFGEAARLDHAAPIALGAFFALLGYAMPQIKQNYTIGVRLPWTLESEKVWDVTHAFVGRAWISVGLTTAVLAAIPETVLELGGAPIALLLGGLAVSIAAAVVIAYRTWRDSQRRRRSAARRRTPRRRTSRR
ncbi:MAG: SdpI family protein [Candidatus Limnocylindrus sp.]